MSAALRAKVGLARAIGTLSRRSGRGGGTTLPGRALLRLEPDAVRLLGSGLPGGTALISATNGKTTTAGMVAAAMRAAGRAPIHNRAGSNMSWGVATALAEQRGKEGLFEVDEAWLPRIARELGPRSITLANLFRDQLDRYGELEILADEWATLVAELAGATRLVLNADDPLVADLGRDAEGAERAGVSYFGIDDPAHALGATQHAHDAKHCRRCGSSYAYERAFVGHLGHYSCPNCGAKRPAPTISARRIELRGLDGTDVEVALPSGTVSLELPLPGLYNVYNALAAIATAQAIGIAPEQAVEGIEDMDAVFGRTETLRAGTVDLSILLIKNPAGATEVLRTLAQEAQREEGRELDLWLALNDRIADGRDVSWIWDADFELLAPHVRVAHCTGTRAAEMAVRLAYAGWPRERLRVTEGIAESLDLALAGAPGRLFCLPTYTALIELRTLLARRGIAREFWR